MKKLLFIPILFFYLQSFATTYYVNATAGNDGNVGTSTGAAWKTLSKVNSFQASLVAGDIILFNRGDVFYGTITIGKTGTAGNVITYGAYGSGANPVINGFNSTAITWSNLSSNIWESSSAVSTLTTSTVVLVNGAVTPIGRYPNSGWLLATGTPTFNTTTKVGTVAASSLGGVNWTNGQLCLRSYPWALEVNPITSQSGTTITYTGTSASLAATTGFGFFIQNDSLTLDAQNEWWYSQYTKKLRMYSTSTPTNVLLSIIDYLFIIPSGKDYITVQNIDFKGANNTAISVRSAKNIIITGCNFYDCFDAVGTNGFLSNGANINVNNCSFHRLNNHAWDNGDFTQRGSVFNNNIVDSVGMILGQWFETNDNSADGIRLLDVSCSASYNVISNVGHSGIVVSRGDSLTASYNLISNYGMTRYDAGGIYSWNSPPDTASIHIRTIDHNIILQSNQVNDGSIGTRDISLWGIYLDGNSVRTTATNNTVTQGGTAGITFYRNGEIITRNNTLYNNGRYQIQFTRDGGGLYPTNCDIKNNYYISKTASQFCLNYREDGATFPINTSDSNYYARPIDDNLTIQTVVSFTATLRNLAMWQTLTGQDAHSHKSPVAITNVNQLFFAYNANNYDSTITIPSGTWVDVTGAPFNTGSTILHAYTSIVLISTGTNIPPIANAGTNKNITLPTATITQVGSGSDPDGTISAYLWTQFSGPSTATIVSPTSATTVINSLSVAGTYVFQLKVTDNLGATGTDTMSCVVNSSPPPNLPPVVDAGGNKIITLPTSTIMQTGSATDPDGTIAGYLWTQSGSNPTAASIVSPLAATTSIIGMTVAGVYSFTLTATDNLGATGSQTITATVNAVVPVPPIAHAGIDQAISWPTNSVTLSGSATAGTGTIASYLWTKISGSIGTITNPNTASTTVTGLDVGTYLYQLTVTDNSGFQGKDTMQVTVNKGSASLSYTIVSVTYNAAPQSIGIVTSPAGLATATTYNGVNIPPTLAGSYATASNITDVAHWNSTPITGTFTITPLAGTFTASNTSVQYDSLLHTIAVSTSNPAITYTISGAPQRYKNTYAVTIHNTNSNFSVPDANVTLTITAGIAPPLVWNPATPQIYPYALGAAVLNAGDSKSGTYHYTPLAGFVPSAGSLQLKVDFVPNDTNLAPIIGTTRTITINKGTDVMTASDTIQYADGNPKPITVTTLHGGTVVITYDGSTTTAPSTVGDHPFSATYSDANWQATTITGTLHILSNVSIIKITNFANRIFTGLPIDVTVTSAYPYSLVYTPSNHTDVNNNIRVIATINDGIHTGADTAIMSIIKATPIGTWSPISNQTYIYTVQSGILNASTATAGSWAYNVSVGDTLIPGTYNLIAVFTPTDAANYNSITLTNSITVNKGNATINTSGTSKQYNGLVQYITAATTPQNLDSLVITYTGNHLDAGSYPFTARLFSNLYSASNVSGTLIISQASYTLSWAQPAAIPYQTPLSITQLNATSTIAGTFTYNYPIGTILQPGLHILTATFHPTDLVNYPIQNISVTITVGAENFPPKIYVTPNFFQKTLN